MKDKNKKNKKQVWIDFWKMIQPFHKRMIVLLTWILCINAFALVAPYVMKLIIDNLTAFEPDNLIDLLKFILLFFVVEQANSFLHYFRDRKQFKIYFDIDHFFQMKAQEKLLTLSLDYHEKENTGNKIIKIDRGIQKILDLWTNMSWEAVPTILQLLLTIIAMVFIDWRFSAMIILFAPLFIGLSFYSNKILYPVRQERYKKGEEAGGKMAQAVININTVKSFVQEKREVQEFKNIRDTIRDDGIKEWYKLTNYSVARNLIVDIGRVSSILLAAYLVYTGSITVGSMVFVVTLSEKVYFSLYRLSRFYDRIEEGFVAIERLLKVFNEKQTIKNKENAKKPKNLKGDISFSNVSFSYDGSKQRALENVNLEIEAGTVLALVGPSGGGKTTTARMIYRHYDPSKGEIKIDGVNVADYDLFAFRKHIAIVPQEVDIFNMSIRDNISYAKPTASLKEIKNAAKIANAIEFIDKLESKYNTLVGERGMKLSGGQRQRIGIARAVLANPRILIFDEATSNLDSYSERLIQNAMDALTKDRTVIIIAHRLSTIKKADKIVVLSEGSICEQGTHEELSRQDSGLYAKLISLQELGDIKE